MLSNNTCRHQKTRCYNKFANKTIAPKPQALRWNLISEIFDFVCIHFSPRGTMRQIMYKNVEVIELRLGLFVNSSATNGKNYIRLYYNPGVSLSSQRLPLIESARQKDYQLTCLDKTSE